MQGELIGRPRDDEYDPYYKGYIERVAESDLLVGLESGMEEALAVIGSLSEEQGALRYAPGKWSCRKHWR